VRCKRVRRVWGASRVCASPERLTRDASSPCPAPCPSSGWSLSSASESTSFQPTSTKVPASPHAIPPGPAAPRTPLHEPNLSLSCSHRPDHTQGGQIGPVARRRSRLRCSAHLCPPPFRRAAVCHSWTTAIPAISSPTSPCRRQCVCPASSRPSRKTRPRSAPPSL
jgi:hypothetical protein